ncbi:MAG TPA: Ppx/GppA phosphatase family protein [Gemmatimonadales bacterium]|nr:Ppx/GppA phosphatase family protein [Gemmatimonadales bacterium]
MSVVPLPERRERLAAIDVGSNSIRLLVAEVGPHSGITVIDEVKEQPRLATGVAQTGRLDPGAMERAVAGLRRMYGVCERRNVSRIAAVATSAVREAINGEQFVKRVKDEIGLDLRIIDGEAEAALSYRSVAHHFPLEGGRTVVADIGGGSLELIGAVDGLIEHTLSLPFGAVRLTELHLDQKDTRSAVRELREYLRRQFRRRLPLRDWSATTLIGSGGSFTNLGRMAAARRGLSASEPVHGTAVTVAEVEHMLAWLAGMSPEKRAAVPGLNPQRADIILAGLAVTAELLERIEAREVKISAFGLREGLILDMAGAEAAPAAVEPLRLIREFAERCHSDRRHVEHVRLLALNLFDLLADRLEASAEERGLLEAASLLHDVGQLVSYRKHHKHSYQLIMHGERLPFSPRERALVALISRYHRRRGPKKKHKDFAALPAEDQLIVKRLSGILRIAEGLDRGHSAIVEKLVVEVCPTVLTVKAVPRYADADLSLECWGAMEQADVLAKVLGRDVLIEPAMP